jgi:hypothetical protein
MDDCIPTVLLDFFDHTTFYLWVLGLEQLYLCLVLSLGVIAALLGVHTLFWKAEVLHIYSLMIEVCSEKSEGPRNGIHEGMIIQRCTKQAEETCLNVALSVL